MKDEYAIIIIKDFRIIIFIKLQRNGTNVRTYVLRSYRSRVILVHFKTNDP